MLTYLRARHKNSDEDVTNVPAKLFVLPYCVIWKHDNFPQFNLSCTIHLLRVLSQETPLFKQKILVFLEMEKSFSYCDVLVLIITPFLSHFSFLKWIVINSFNNLTNSDLWWGTSFYRFVACDSIWVSLLLRFRCNSENGCS